MYETLKFTEMTTRRVIDAKDKDGEKVYVKGHAKATYMSDGRTVEDAIKQIGTGGGGGGIIAETDPVFSASPAADITEEQIRTWDDTHEFVEDLDEDISKLYDALNSKQDTLVSGENIKTINGKSIVGSGNITISGSGSAQLPLNTVIINLRGSSLAIPSGKVTGLALLQTGGGTFALSADKKVGEDNVWVIRFSISIDNLGIYQVVADEGYSIKWANGVAPTFENGKYYEMSFRLIGTTFLGVWASFE